MRWVLKGGEFDILGVPFDERGPRTDEIIRAMKELWTSDHPRFKGRWVRLKLEQVNATSWRVGVMRLGIKPSSRR